MQQSAVLLADNVQPMGTFGVKSGLDEEHSTDVGAIMGGPSAFLTTHMTSLV